MTMPRYCNLNTRRLPSAHATVPTIPMILQFKSLRLIRSTFATRQFQYSQQRSITKSPTMASNKGMLAFGGNGGTERICGAQVHASRDNFDSAIPCQENVSISFLPSLTQCVVEDMEQVRNASAENEHKKKENTGSITTSTNHTDDSGFTRPQHDKSAGKKPEADSASGVTTAANRTTDSGFTSPGDDMRKTRSSNKQDSKNSNI